MSRETRKMAREAAIANVMVTEAGEEVKLSAQEQLDRMPPISDLQLWLKDALEANARTQAKVDEIKAQVKRYRTLQVQLYKAELRTSDN